MLDSSQRSGVQTALDGYDESCLPRRRYNYVNLVSGGDPQQSSKTEQAEAALDAMMLSLACKVVVPAAYELFPESPDTLHGGFGALVGVPVLIEFDAIVSLRVPRDITLRQGEVPSRRRGNGPADPLPREKCESIPAQTRRRRSMSDGAPACPSRNAALQLGIIRKQDIPTGTAATRSRGRERTKPDRSRNWSNSQSTLARGATWFDAPIFDHPACLIRACLCGPARVASSSPLGNVLFANESKCSAWSAKGMPMCAHTS